MNSFPQNPTDGTVFEHRPGIYYIYSAATKQWSRVTGGLFPSEATTTTDGLMSPDDYAKLNRLVIPPPSSTLQAGEDGIVFDTGIISLHGDDFVTISGDGTLISEGAPKTLPLQLHQHTNYFDFKIDIERLFKHLQDEGKIVIRAPRGDKGKRGPQGDPGEDELQVGPTGPKGDAGANAPQIGVLSTEPIPFKLKDNVHRAIVSLATEEVSPEENYLVVTRSRVGNPNACPSQVNIQPGSSSWVMAFPDDSQGVACRPIFYIDIDGLLEAIEEKFKSEADRIKSGYENIASYWLRTMSEVFDAQKATLCCALENCRSRGRNQDTRRYLEMARLQAAAADYKVVVGGQEAVDGEAYTYTTTVSTSISKGTQAIPGTVDSGCKTGGWSLTIAVENGDCECEPLTLGFNHCNRAYNSTTDTVTWSRTFSEGTECAYEGIIELASSGTDEGVLSLKLYNNGAHVATYSLIGDLDDLCANGGTLTKESLGIASGVCSDWPETCTLEPITTCTDGGSSGTPSDGYSTEPFLFPITVPISEKCTVKSIAANITWSSFQSLCSLQVIYGGAVIYDTGCAQPNRDNFEVSAEGAHDVVYIRVLTSHCGDPAQESAAWRFDANVQFTIGCDTDRETIPFCENRNVAEVSSYSLNFPNADSIYSGETFTVTDGSGNSLTITYSNSGNKIVMAALPPREYEYTITFDDSWTGTKFAAETAAVLANSGLKIDASVSGSILTMRGVQTVVQGAAPTVIITPDLPNARRPTPISQIPPLPPISDPTLGDHLSDPSANPTVALPPAVTIETSQAQKQPLSVISRTTYGNTTLNGNEWRKQSNYWVGSVGYQASGHRNTQYLIFSDFGITVPDDAIITGIEVTVERLSLRSPRGNNDASDTLADVEDHKIQLVLDGEVLPEDLAGTFTGGPKWQKWGGYTDFPPFRGSTATTTSFNIYGGSTNKWGRDWLASEINSCGFGVAIAAKDSGSTTKTGAALVKTVYVTVYYTHQVQANIKGEVPSQTRSVKPPVAVTGESISWLKTPSTTTHGSWENFGNILNNDRTSKASVTLPAGGVSERIGVSGWGTKTMSDWQSVSSLNVAKVGDGSVQSRVLTPISGIRRTGRVIGVIVTLEDVETSGGEFRITEARITRYRANPGSTQSIVESANKSTDVFTADPIVTGGCSTSIEFGGPTDTWGLELLGSDILYTDKSKYTTFHFRVSQVGGSSDATFSFSGIKVQLFWENEYSVVASSTSPAQVFDLSGEPIEQIAISKSRSRLVLTDSKLVNADMELESAQNVEISYSSDAANGSLIIEGTQGKRIAKFPEAIEPGLYYLAITNKSRANGLLRLRSPQHSVTFLKGSGPGWDEQFIVGPNEIFGLAGPPPGKSWWVHAKVSESQVPTKAGDELVLEARRHVGSVRQAARLQLPAGQYVVEIKECNARIGGKYHAHVILSDGSRYYQFKNRGPQDTVAKLKRAYLGASLEINHKGGDLLAYISSPSAVVGTGSVKLVFHDKAKYLVTAGMRTNALAAPAPVTPHCNMDVSHLKWYESQWQSRNCHGAVVNVAGQDYIIILKLVDDKDPSSENPHTPCITAYRKFGHPAFAWPTFDGETFVGVPKSGSVKYSADERFSQEAILQIKTDRADRIVGNTSLISFVLVPMAH